MLVRNCQLRYYLGGGESFIWRTGFWYLDGPGLLFERDSLGSLVMGCA
jgi:hypothetical protein